MSAVSFKNVSEISLSWQNTLAPHPKPRPKPKPTPRPGVGGISSEFEEIVEVLRLGFNALAKANEQSVRSGSSELSSGMEVSTPSGSNHPVKSELKRNAGGEDRVTGEAFDASPRAARLDDSNPETGVGEYDRLDEFVIEGETLRSELDDSGCTKAMAGDLVVIITFAGLCKQRGISDR
ncbi:hypothetical protein LENED_000794 [Lentinula edodes]|uniref:Uncharacterized protein n=1 Tax=Lentinula edodes TaxID=5353 RepID=A0A1Q3DWY0_LENED|nr:hypothetical protein LENED_000794 [Lentinula edodes]